MCPCWCPNPTGRCVFFLYWLCPIWVLFLLFNIIGSSPAWFVSKKNYPFKAEEAPSHLWVSWSEKNLLLQAEVDMMGTYIILNTYTTAEGLRKPIICKYLILAWNRMRMIWVSTHIRQPKKDKLEGKRSRNLLKLTLRIEEEMNNRCIITKRGYQFH